MAATTISSFLTTTTTTTTRKNLLFPLSSSLVTGSRRIDRFSLKSTPTDNTSQVVSSSSSSPSSSLDSSASDVVRKFYDGINSRNLSTVVDLIAHDCVYEDLVFPQPFVGRKAILEFFEKFIYTISQDLQFAIDDISGEDTSAVGVTWHLEWRGKPFPFSKGCSFYRLKVEEDGRRKIIYGRDIVEPAAKPGDFALVAIRSVTWLLEQFPQLAERF
ncbi:putative NTF2-like domain superfamily, SnoaL-like domain-containing protein [Helianthus anomalus]